MPSALGRRASSCPERTARVGSRRTRGRNASSILAVYEMSGARCGPALSKGSTMKRVPLALAFLVVAGTASAAIFSPPTLEITGNQSATISPVAKSIAPLTIPTGRAPVPLPHLPKPSEVASLAEPPVAAVSIAPRPRPIAPIPPRADRPIEGAQQVRSLSETQCGGRPMKSIAVLPDGSVHVQC